MIINKSKGQSLNMANIDLKTSSYNHNQLYIVFSEIIDISKLALSYKEDEKEEKTENLIFPKALQLNQ